MAQHDKKGQQAVSQGVKLIPRITVQLFCATPQTAHAAQEAQADRRMNKVALKIHQGGVQACLATFKDAPTPNLIIIESDIDSAELMMRLQELAPNCDVGTQVIIIGAHNDIMLFRELMKAGVSDYLVAPITPHGLIESISNLYTAEEAKPIGRTIGFYGAKGGVGASTVAHNVGWALSQAADQNVLIMDFDMAFGTLGLDFNQDPPHGIAEAMFSGDTPDEMLFERLVSKCAKNISLLTAPSTLDRTYDFAQRDFDAILELAQSSVPAVIVDMPHAWTNWTEHTMKTLDELVIVAEPDLANLRNAKNLIDHFNKNRQGEAPTRLVLNRVGVPKRPEISVNDFASSLDVELVGQIGFDPAIFGAASNNGQMVAEVSSGSKAVDAFKTIAMVVTGRENGVLSAKTKLSLTDLLGGLTRKQA